MLKSSTKHMDDECLKVCLRIYLVYHGQFIISIIFLTFICCIVNELYDTFM